MEPEIINTNTAANTSTVNYKDMLQEMGRQLSFRKKDLFKRTLLISWPAIIISIGAYLWHTWTQTMSKEALAHKLAFLDGINEITVILCIVAICFFVVFYAFLISTVVSIEKHLWIDSYFDNKNMDSKTSWRIAWKLFIPLLKFTFNVFVKYYLLPTLLTVGGFFGIAFLSLKRDLISLLPSPMMWVLVIFVYFLLIGIYFYFLKVKLRFIFFLFLDTYNNTTFTYGTLFQEIESLNKISGSESFKKALMVNFGTDAVYGITLVAIKALQAGFNSLGQVGGILGAAARPLAEEAARQIKSFARLSAIYLLYRQARVMLYNEPQKINEYIDSLR